MPNRVRMTLGSAAIASLVLPVAPLFAQSSPVGLTYTVILPAGQFGSLAFTNSVSNNLASAKRFCADLEDDSYTVDCLSERFEEIADDIPKGSDYDQVREVLQKASDDLRNLARANRDTGRPRARVGRAGTAERSSRPLTPVRPDAAAQVNQQALAILEEAETVLLRSADTQSKVAQYTQIAEAIGSNKVLLRST